MNGNYVAQYYQRQPMMRRVEGDARWLHLVWSVVILALIVAGVVWVVKLLAQHHMPVNRDPVDIAKERYAKGEITKAELAEIRKELK